jgi:hypothetical protein
VPVAAGAPEVDVYTLAEEVTAGLAGLEVPLRVAVMGCAAERTRGEAREADLGVASGNGKGQIFVRGEVVETVPGAADRRGAHRGGACGWPSQMEGQAGSPATGDYRLSAVRAGHPLSSRGALPGPTHHCRRPRPKPSLAESNT